MPKTCAGNRGAVRVRYQELVAEANEAYLARVRASLEDAKAGRVRKFKTADALMKALDSEEPG